MFLTCDNGLISAIFLRDLCVQKTKPVRSLCNLCVTIDQCEYDSRLGTMIPFHLVTDIVCMYIDSQG